MPPAIHIRAATSADRTEWLRLLMGLYPAEPESEHVPAVDAFLSGTPSPGLLPALVLVLERPEGGLGGLLELTVRNTAEGCTGATPYVESWYVDPDLRGQGAGRALIAAAEDWSRHHGYTEIASDTWLHNEASQQAHFALGFEEAERIVCFRKSL